MGAGLGGEQCDLDGCTATARMGSALCAGHGEDWPNSCVSLNSLACAFLDCVKNAVEVRNSNTHAHSGLTALTHQQFHTLTREPDARAGQDVLPGARGRAALPESDVQEAGAGDDGDVPVARRRAEVRAPGVHAGRGGQRRVLRHPRRPPPVPEQRCAVQR
jgi:hypothetical protein